MNTFIITAGGIGKRMGTQLPKQFIQIHNKPVLIHTLEKFHQFDSKAQLIITLPSEWLTYWEEILVTYNCNIPHTVVTGGTERYDSIKNALSKATGNIIGVHDGVRPGVNSNTIQSCIDAALKEGSGVPFIELKDSIRKINGTQSTALIRKDYVLIQTPQIFQAEIIKKAYEIPFNQGITDDASLVEQAGYTIKLVSGNEENIKITTPVDLKIAELYLK